MIRHVTWKKSVYTLRGQEMDKAQLDESQPYKKAKVYVADDKSIIFELHDDKIKFRVGRDTKLGTIKALAKFAIKNQKPLELIDAPMNQLFAVDKMVVLVNDTLAT